MPSSLTDQLQTLAELHRSGALTEGEFSLAKTHLLRRLTAADAPAPEPQQPQPCAQVGPSDSEFLHACRRCASDRVGDEGQTWVVAKGQCNNNEEYDCT